MAFRLGEKVRVHVEVSENDDAVFIFPPFDDPELQKAQKEMVSTRSVIRRNKMKDRAFEARVAFFDAVAEDVENVEVPDGNGGYTPLKAGKHPNWKDRIPVNWKVSAAIFFEEKATLSEDEQGN